MSMVDPRSSALSAALNQGRLTPVYQPIWTIDGQLVGYEALTRFPNGCPPDAVWQLAERQHVATELDAIALNSAVAEATDLAGALFLNITAMQLHSPSKLVRYGGPDRIVLEVTETELAADDGREGVQWLKSRGYRIAMDDAGVGWSTEERLGWLEPDIVKLDHTLVYAFCNGAPSSLSRWIRQANAIGAAVLAEGVEDVRWIARLRAEGVGLIQGYAAGRPRAASYWNLTAPLRASNALRPGAALWGS